MYRSTKIFGVFDGARFENHKIIGETVANARGGSPPLCSFFRAAWRANFACVNGGASREARRPTIALYRNGTRPRDMARAHDAMPRTAPMARRRDGDIAPYRNGARQWGPHHGTRQRGPQRDTVTEADGAARAGRPGGQASRPTATGPERGGCEGRKARGRGKKKKHASSGDEACVRNG